MKKLLSSLILSAVLAASPLAKDKEKPISESDRAAIRDTQVQALQLMLRLQPLELQLQALQQKLNESIAQAIRHSGKDPEKYTLDINTWQITEKPALPAPPEPVKILPNGPDLAQPAMPTAKAPEPEAPKQ